MTGQPAGEGGADFIQRGQAPLPPPHWRRRWCPVIVSIWFGLLMPYAMFAGWIKILSLRGHSQRSIQAEPSGVKCLKPYQPDSPKFLWCDVKLNFDGHIIRLSSALEAAVIFRFYRFIQKASIAPSFSAVDIDDCLGDKRADYQNCSGLYAALCIATAQYSHTIT